MPILGHRLGLGAGTAGAKVPGWSAEVVPRCTESALLVKVMP